MAQANAGPARFSTKNKDARMVKLAITDMPAQQMS